MKLPESLRHISVVVVRSKRRKKSITIRVLPTEVQVQCPARTPDSYVEALLDERSAWILQQWQVVQSRTLSPTWPPEQLSLHGQPIELERQTVANRKTVAVRHKPGKLVVIAPPGLTDERERQVVIGWYKQQALQVLKMRTDAWAKRLGLHYEKLRVKDQKSRWGSCSKSGNLNFNWRLLMTPEFVMDYVVVHELCHLREMNHSTRFWELVQSAFPRQKEARLWLKEHGSSLFI